MSLCSNTCVACVYDVHSHLAKLVPLHRRRLRKGVCFTGSVSASRLYIVEQLSIVLTPFPAGARLPGLLLTFEHLPMLRTLVLL